MEQNEPVSSIDKIIELYKKDVDVTLLKENLKLTPTERVQRLQDMVTAFERMQEARKNHDKV